ncbi:helix-turn-helix domain-containing protein [Paenibacillus sp. MMO-177]|uniref:helix-turn-helix domain-containing protein n=1 Tax=Paenibacillus sp. MMO-177 TaxID=3081289 RepID=UPI003018E549
MDIRIEFGQRIKELRARSGMSQEHLAYRAGLDRSYISGVERGERNVSIINIEKIASALQITVAYLFSGERFSPKQAYQPKDFLVPFKDRVHYTLDPDKKLLSFQVNGLASGKQDVEYMSNIVLGICSAYGKDELDVLVDHRGMVTSDGEPVVYSPEVAERAVQFQQELTAYSKKVLVLCNSEFMVEQLNHVAKASGIFDKASHLFDKDKDMVGKAYETFDLHDHPFIRTNNG